jgi:hypothetical protein
MSGGFEAIFCILVKEIKEDPELRQYMREQGYDF